MAFALVAATAAPRSLRFHSFVPFPPCVPFVPWTVHGTRGNEWTSRGSRIAVFASVAEPAIFLSLIFLSSIRAYPCHPRFLLLIHVIRAIRGFLRLVGLRPRHISEFQIHAQSTSFDPERFWLSGRMIHDSGGDHRDAFVGER